MWTATAAFRHDDLPVHGHRQMDGPQQRDHRRVYLRGGGGCDSTMRLTIDGTEYQVSVRELFRAPRWWRSGMR